jgi:hypothetical protein
LRRRAAGAALLAGLFAAAPAAAVIPTPERLTDAAARSNADAARTSALRIEVALLTQPPEQGESEPIASGELLADPADQARLDLVGRNGVHERHVLSGGRLSAWRDGQPLDDPRALLPPLALLQQRSGPALRELLRRLGVDLDAAELGQSHGRDCFVVGGRDRAGEPQGLSRPSLWLDAYSFETVRVDRGDGARFRFGPLRELAGHQLPAWVALEEVGKSTLYLELRAASAARPSAADFAAPAAP